MRNNSFSDKERLEFYAQQIHDSGVDITLNQKEWTEIAYACASQGEDGREPFHTISSHFPGYSREECDQHYSYCLRTSRNALSIGTIVKIAGDYGVKLHLPRGRRPQSQEDREEGQRNLISQMTAILKQQAEWRFNVWRQRPEIKEEGMDWRPVQERDLDTYLCRLQQNGIKVTMQCLTSLISSRDFSEDFDAFNSWLDSLQPWNPETDFDYIHDFFNGHLEFNDPESEEFYYQMLKKWFVGMVSMMRGLSNENPIMPILKGSQHIGKSYYSRHILPPHLSSYQIEVGPAAIIDKDFIISLSETPLILIDEFFLGGEKRGDIFKYLVTSNSSNVRDSYAHYREPRVRRASLFTTTNEENCIPNSDGSRRYLVVDLKGTVDLVNFPLPYDGAYAQALYLLEHGFQHKPDHDESMQISKHNRKFEQLDDCEEILKIYFRTPQSGEKGEACSAGDIKIKLRNMGYQGRDFDASKIGKAMKRMGFQSKFIHGCHRYLVAKIDQNEYTKVIQNEAKAFSVPMA